MSEEPGAAPETGGDGGGLKGKLTKKIGPLPAWAWGAIAVVGFLILRARSKASTTTGGTVADSNAVTGQTASFAQQNSTEQTLTNAYNATKADRDSLAAQVQSLQQQLVTGTAPGSVGTGTGTGTGTTTPPAGTGASSGTPAPSTPQWLDKAYQDLLGRAPTSAEAANSSWLGFGASGPTSTADYLSVAHAIGGSQEGLAYQAKNPNAFIGGQYDFVLNRAADAGGLAYFQGKEAQGPAAEVGAFDQAVTQGGEQRH